jgi:hypothetical protein
MVVSTQIKQRWDTREYADIATTEYDQGTLKVSFMDGSEVSLPVADLAPYGVTDHEWQGVRSETHHIAVPTRNGAVEIPWDVIRALTDQKFSQFLTEHAANTTRRTESRFSA